MPMNILAYLHALTTQFYLCLCVCILPFSYDMMHLFFWERENAKKTHVFSTWLKENIPLRALSHTHTRIYIDVSDFVMMCVHFCIYIYLFFSDTNQFSASRRKSRGSCLEKGISCEFLLYDCISTKIFIGAFRKAHKTFSFWKRSPFWNEQLSGYGVRRKSLNGSEFSGG